MLKALCNASLTFLILPIISEMEKVFAKKPGFLPYKENQVLNFGSSRAKNAELTNHYLHY